MYTVMEIPLTRQGRRGTILSVVYSHIVNRSQETTVATRRHVIKNVIWDGKHETKNLHTITNVQWEESGPLTLSKERKRTKGTAEANTSQRHPKRGRMR